MMIPNRFPKPQPKSECKISIKRNKEGKIISVKRDGKCTKEDMMVFAERNGIEIEE